jgi:hypothetical protein
MTVPEPLPPTSMFPAKCPKCRMDILESHPYTWCRNCGTPLPAELVAALRAPKGRPPVDKPAQGAGDVSDVSGATIFLTMIGLGFMAAGLYLLLNPGVHVDSELAGGLFPGGVANLQKLTMGETFTIVGAIFLAAAWRPR